MSAADNDASDCVKLLLDHNFSVNIEDENHDNILCRAIKRRRQYVDFVAIIICIMKLIRTYSTVGVKKR